MHICPEELMLVLAAVPCVGGLLKLLRGWLGV